MKSKSLLAAFAVALLSILMAPAAFAETSPPASAAVSASATAPAAGSTSGAPVDTAASPSPAAAPATRKAKIVKARVLVDCSHGKCNDVVEVEDAVAKAGVAAGELDTERASIAYAEGLAQ